MSFTSARRDLTLVVIAKAISFLGDELATVALMLRMQAHGAGAGSVAALLVANLAPIVLLSGVVGRVVDRHDNRRLLVLSSAAQAGVCVALSAASAPGTVLGLVALLGVGQAVNGATWQAVLPSLVTPERLPRALGLAQAASTAAGIAAPALAGLLTGWFGARVPLLVDAASFVVILGAAASMRTRRVVAPSSGPMPGGLSIVRRDPLLRTTIALLGVFVLIGAMVNVVEVFLVRETLHASTLWFGLTGAGYSVGVLCGTLLGGRLSGTVRLARAFVAAAALLGAGLAAMGLAPDVGWLLGIGVAAGAMNGVLNVATSALVLGTAAPDERGRVAALLGGVVSATSLGAYVMGALLSAQLGPRGVFVLAGGLGLLAPLACGRMLLRAAGRTQPSAPVTADLAVPAPEGAAA